VAAFWYAIIPGLTGALGYFPSALLGMGEPLPAGVARQWARWGRSPGYLSDDTDDAGRSLADAHRAFRAPVLSLNFSDDFFAPRRAAATLLSWYGGADRELRHLHPGDVGQRRVGHFGFFRPAVGGALWPEIADWLAARAGVAARI
jgi:predicted alpha/beta hydrolase